MENSSRGWPGNRSADEVFFRGCCRRADSDRGSAARFRCHSTISPISPGLRKAARRDRFPPVQKASCDLGNSCLRTSFKQANSEHAKIFGVPIRSPAERKHAPVLVMGGHRSVTNELAPVVLRQSWMRGIYPTFPGTKLWLNLHTPDWPARRWIGSRTRGRAGAAGCVGSTLIAFTRSQTRVHDWP